VELPVERPDDFSNSRFRRRRARYCVQNVSLLLPAGGVRRVEKSVPDGTVGSSLK